MNKFADGFLLSHEERGGRIPVGIQLTSDEMRRQIVKLFTDSFLAQIRTTKGISARDLSLSIGQSKSYINNIENKKSNISMPMFLYICEYLKIHPKDFFDDNISYPTQLNQLIENLKELNENQLSNIDSVVREILKK